MYITVVGLSHRTATVELRECLSVPADQIAPTLQGLVANSPHVLEAALLSTCNRSEIYAVLSDTEQGLKEITQYLSRAQNVPLAVLQRQLFILLHDDAVMHLLRVSAGLDSMILGEGQILAQVKSTYNVAQKEAKTTGRILNELFKVAISSGKLVRDKTQIGAGAVSISSAAVELAHRKLGLKGQHNLVIGCGEMGRLVVQHLVAKGADRITLLNRTLIRAETLAQQFPQQPIVAVPWEKLQEAVEAADLVFTSTATQEPLLTRAHVEGLNRLERRLTFFDIGVPRNVAAEVKEVAGVFAYNVDDLQQVVDHNLAHRQQLVQQAQLLLDEEVAKFMHWCRYTLDAVPTLNSFRQKIEAIRLAEMEKALSRLGNEFGGKHQEVIDGLTRAIVNKILNDPVLKIRAEQDIQARQQALRVLQTLFNLEL